MNNFSKNLDKMSEMFYKMTSSLEQENEALREQLKTAQELAENSIKLYNEQLEKSAKYKEALESIVSHETDLHECACGRSESLEDCNFVYLAKEVLGDK